MTEKLLQFLWQFQYFNKSGLQTVSGESVQVLFPGKANTNQGPDFLDARIRIGATLFAGSVELHLKTSQWTVHGHQHDENYNNVILHVVMEHDLPGEGEGVPVLELQGRIASILLSTYNSLMQAASFIPCQHSITSVRPIVWEAWKERLLAERLTRKGGEVLALLAANGYHWEEAFWWMLARNFGMSVNAEAFLAIARSIPLTVLARHKHSIHQLEAVLLGQAGLLQGNFEDAYMQLLQREYRFAARKYGFRPVEIPVHFLRMRPGSFPTVRLAQLAMLVYGSTHLFSRVLETEEMTSLTIMFDVTANDYWHYRFLPDQPSGFRKKRLGKDMVSSIVINTVAPFLYAYGLYHKLEKYQLRALRWLEELDPEDNHITKNFKSLGVKAGSAFDSQALIELKKNYCDCKKCLGCSVGNAVLKGSERP